VLREAACLQGEMRDDATALADWLPLTSHWKRVLVNAIGWERTKAVREAGISAQSFYAFPQKTDRCLTPATTIPPTSAS
jgi:hypothetical protein